MIRKLPSGKYRLYSRSINPKTGKRRNLGTFATREVVGAENLTGNRFLIGRHRSTRPFRRL